MSVTVANDPASDAASSCDGVAVVVSGKPRPIGNLQVTRVLPAREQRTVGPFVFLDHMGPATFSPGTGFDVPPHPHIGLSTVTFLFDGEAVHRDSIGFVQTIRPGDVNLMTAGRGVVHSERSDPAWRVAGGSMHGLQLWLGLPTSHEEIDPTFAHHPQATLPEVALPGARVRVLLGAGFGAVSPIAHPSRPFFAVVSVEAGASLSVPAEDGESRAIYVVDGEVRAGQGTFGALQLLAGTPGATIRVTATRPSRLALLGGPPLDGPRFLDWNFVSSMRERLAEARDLWKAQAFARIPGDDVDFVPYPR